MPGLGFVQGDGGTAELGMSQASAIVRDVTECVEGDLLKAWERATRGLQTLCGTCCLLFPMYNRLESHLQFEEPRRT